MFDNKERIHILEWLKVKGNPIIAIWAAERLGAPQGEIHRFRVEMLAQPTVQYWIGCLLQVAEKPVIHNSFDTCLENAMRKVLLFGVREQDDPRLAQFNHRALDRLIYLLEHPTWLNPVEYTILASYLNGMGCRHEAVTMVLQERLDSAHWFAANGEFDIHTDPSGFPAIPTARRMHPLIHPKFYPDGKYLYPLVYDLFAWANLPPVLDTPDNRQKVDAILTSVLDERYQRLPWGYGLIFVPPNKYYGMGWSLHLPRFFETEPNGAPDTSVVWWAEAMAGFPVMARSAWFMRILEHLDSFRTADGLWKFPTAYVTEAKDKYFVGGGHMGLGEARKGGDGLKIESTAWMMRIQEKLALLST